MRTFKVIFHEGGQHKCLSVLELQFETVTDVSIWAEEMGYDLVSVEAI